MRIAVQLDHPSKLNPVTDSSFFLVEEAQSRGFEVYFYEPEQLSMRGRVLSAPMRRLTLDMASTPVWHADEASTCALDTFDLVLMRQDPPFDMAYITATHLLETIAHTVPVWNNPASVRNAPEKLSVMGFAEYMPDTLISRDAKAIAAFAETHDAIVAKPLYGFGGNGVFKFTRGDANLETLLELWTNTSREPLIWQEFRPEVKDADRRVLFINGEVAATFGRLPAEHSIRANMRVGGKPIASPTLTARQQEACDKLSPFLKSQGLMLAGIDFIGDYLTEINVTCPTGLRAAQRLYGLNLASRFWDCVLQQR